MSESNQTNYLYGFISNAFKGIFLPLVFPYILYKLYIKITNDKLLSSTKLQNKVILITGASSGLGEGFDFDFIIFCIICIIKTLNVMSITLCIVFFLLIYQL